MKGSRKRTEYPSGVFMFHGEDILNASFTGASSPKYEIVSTNCEEGCEDEN